MAGAVGCSLGSQRTSGTQALLFRVLHTNGGMKYVILVITDPISDADRIATLRQRCLRAKPWPIWWDPVTMARSLRESEGVGSWQLRRGLLTRDRLAALPFDLDDRELLMGRLGPPADVPGPERQEAEEYLKRYEWPGGQSGHCALDMTRLFALGIDGLAAEIEALRGRAAGEKADVYQSFLYALDGFGHMIEHAARTAEEASLRTYTRTMWHRRPRRCVLP